MTCKVCDNPTQYESTGKGFRDYCSPSCMQKWRWENGERDHNSSPFNTLEIQEKSKQTNFERYGAVSHMQNPENAKRWRENYKAKTGYDSPLSNPNLRDLLSEDDKQRIIQYRKDNPRASDMSITNMFPGHSRNIISKILRDAGFKPGGRVSKEYRQQIVGYRKAHDATNDEIAAIFTQCSRASIGRILKDAGLVPGGQNANLTQEKKDAIVMYKRQHQSATDTQIAEEFHLFHGTITRTLRDAGIESGWKVEPEERKKIIEYRKNNNHSDAEIARAFKRSSSSVTKILRDAGIGPGSTSKPEMFIYRFVQSQFPQFELKQHDRKVISPLEIDIYIPEIKTGIEMNGLYWHANRERYHYDKFKMAQAAGVSLLQIWDTECDLHHMRVLGSMLKCRMGLAERIPVSECEIIEMPDSMARAFYEYNHWNGFLPSERHFGLTCHNRLVAALSISKARYRRGYTEITRYCTRLNCVVIEGVDKLIKHVEKECQSPMISYSDNRLFSGESFKRNGFNLERDDSIGYFWFKADGSILMRHQTQKRELPEVLKDGFDPHKNEVENMEANGWQKTYDAGRSSWTKEIPDL